MKPGSADALLFDLGNVVVHAPLNLDPETGQVQSSAEIPDVFGGVKLDIRRANAAKNIAFGFGPHVCIGKRVAQLQLEEVYRQLLTRLPDIEYAGGIEMAPNNFVHTIRKLLVRFTPQ